MGFRAVVLMPLISRSNRFVGVLSTSILYVVQTGGVRHGSAAIRRWVGQRIQVPLLDAERAALIREPYSAISCSPARSFTGSGSSVIVASVKRSTLATETAFSNATRTTFVGSMMPASTRSTYCLRLASKP